MPKQKVKERTIVDDMRPLPKNVPEWFLRTGGRRLAQMRKNVDLAEKQVEGMCRILNVCLIPPERPQK